MVEPEDLSGRTFGEFVLRSRIGEGAFGAVYRCEQRNLGREAVVKVLHRRLRRSDVVLKRFQREAQLASLLDHPYAAHVYAFGVEQDDGLFWIAMELVHGTTLHRWLRERGSLTLAQFIPFFQRVAEVVYTAHERGIVHRDLKPSNVMVIERAGQLYPKLLDFGIAKMIDDTAWSALASTASSSVSEQAELLPVPAEADGPGTLTSSMAIADRGRVVRLTHADSMLGSPPYMAPEQWTNAVTVGPAADLYALGILAYEAITGKRPFIGSNLADYAELHREAPVPTVGSDLPTALDPWFARALAKSPEQRWGSALELAAAFRAAAGEPSDRGEPAESDEVSPYLGLASYGAADAAQFFGREIEVSAVVDLVQRRPLQIVVGPSGTGKSSFVHAGVIPRLPRGWRAVTMRPGAVPLATLASCLEEAGGRAAGLMELLASAPAAAAVRVAAAASSGPIVVVIDQLEELFTLCTSRGERRQFAAAIAQLAATADLPVRVIATIRDDYLLRFDELPALRLLLPPALVVLGNPPRDELVRIVVEPARRAGYTLSDPAMAVDMVNAVVGRPGALALLSFAVSRLWELRDRTLRQLTRSAYDAMGGVAGALVRHAEATYESLATEEQPLVREIFRHLVTSDGARASLSTHELRERLASSQADGVMNKLIAARLIATSEIGEDSHAAGASRIEVIHDALLDGWPRLARWIRDDVEGTRMHEQLRIAARQWNARGRSRGLLWRDDALADLQRWRRRSSPRALTGLEAAFAEASQRQARRAAWFRRGLAAIAVSLGVTLVAVWYLGLQSRAAQRATEARLLQEYVDRGREALLDGKSMESVIYLAMARRRGDDSPGTRFALERALDPLQGELGRLTSPRRMWWATFSPDGRQILTTDDLGGQVWEAQTLRPLFALPHGNIVYQAAYSPDGTQIVTAGADGFVKVWNAKTGALRWSLTHKVLRPGVAYGTVAVSPKGDLVAAVNLTGELVNLWDLGTGMLCGEWEDNTVVGQPSLDFSYDGHWFAVGGARGVRVYDAPVAKFVVVFGASNVTTLSFARHDQRLVTGTADGEVVVWSVPDGARIHRLRDLGEKIAHVVFSPDGGYVAATGADGIDRIWNSHAGALYARLDNHRATGVWAEFDATSRFLVTTAADGAVVVSDVVTRMRLSRFEGPRHTVPVARFAPGLKRLIAASWEGTARILDASRSYLRWVTPFVGETCMGGALPEPDRRFIAIACEKQPTQIWDTSLGRMLARLPAITPVPGDFLTPYPIVNTSGSLAAVANGDRVAIYELSSGRVLRTISHSAVVTAMSFVTGGRDIITGCLDGSVVIARDGLEPFVLGKSSAAVDVLGTVPDGRVVVADAGNRLTVYDIVHRSRLAELLLPSRAIAFRMSSDGRRMVAIPSPKIPRSLAVFDLERYQPVVQLDGRKSLIFSAHFVQGDRRILTAGSDGAARLWDVDTGHLWKTYPRAGTYLADAILNPSGTMIITAGGDGVLRFWDLDSVRLLWRLPVFKGRLGGIHFDRDDIVARAFTGELARWTLPSPQDLSAEIGRVLPCLPFRFDEENGTIVEQDPRCAAIR